MAARLRAAGCVFAEEEADLLIAAASSPAALDGMVERRVAGHPLEQVVGWAELGGVRVTVEPGVFVPRHRSELLIRKAVAAARPGAVVVDLCCGSGAIGLAVAAALGAVELHAADIDPVAVRCARRNLASVAAGVHQGDLYEALPPTLAGGIDVLVANVPYVPTAEIAMLPPEARLHEPRLALDGGADGLDVLRRVAAGASRWLRPGGSLLIETSEPQARPAAESFAASGLAPRLARDEELEATVVIGVAGGVTETGARAQGKGY